MSIHQRLSLCKQGWVVVHHFVLNFAREFSVQRQCFSLQDCKECRSFTSTVHNIMKQFRESQCVKAEGGNRYWICNDLDFLLCFLYLYYFLHLYPYYQSFIQSAFLSVRICTRVPLRHLCVYIGSEPVHTPVCVITHFGSFWKFPGYFLRFSFTFFPTVY